MLCNNVLTVLQCCFLGSYCKGSWSSSGRLWHINISWHEMKRQEIRSVLALPLSSEWRCDVDSFIAVPGMFWSSFQVYKSDHFAWWTEQHVSCPKTCYGSPALTGLYFTKLRVKVKFEITTVRCTTLGILFLSVFTMVFCQYSQ